MTNKVKTEQVLGAFNVLNTSKYAKMDDADKTMTDVAGWLFIGASQALIALNHWWLLFAWAPAIAAIFIWRLKWWRTLVALTSIALLFIYSLV